MRALDTIRAWCLLFVGTLFLALCATVPRSASAQAAIPPELRPWVPWVLEAHPTHGCISTGSDTPCVWPGQLNVDVESTSGRFQMRVRVDRPAWVAIPGGPGQWPTDVWSNQGVATVSDRAGRPHIWLRAGNHTVSGRFAWASLPQNLSLPPSAGLVTLTVNGQQVAEPRVDTNGHLPLNLSSDRGATEGDAVELDVTRHILDGVPVQVRTRIDLRVAGQARELALGEVLLKDTLPVAIDSPLPVRVTDGQPAISAQVRPGTWTIQIDAIAQGPVTELTAPSIAFPAWPDAEFWSVATNDDIRSVTIEGGVGVEPGRTPIPADYHTHPAYILQQGDTLTFTEMQRGIPAPPASNLSVDRAIWVDANGEGLTTQDRITGTMQDQWRINVVEPLLLGHVSVDGTDRVVTTDASGTGVEVRSQNLSMVGESRLPSPWQPIPAVGWAIDAQSLSTRIHTPPGWTLLAASGADRTIGTALSEWSVLDLFLVLVLLGTMGRVFGVRTAGLAAVALVLSLQDRGAPGLLWLVTTIASAVDDRVQANTSWSSKLKTASRLLSLGAAALLALQLLQYVSSDLPSRVWPTLSAEHAYDLQGDMLLGNFDVDEAAMAQPEPEAAQRKRAVPSAPVKQSSQPQLRKAKKTKNLYQTLQMDPAAIVQTGPGIPAWRGNTARLSWSGQVASDHTIRLFLLPPLVTKLGAILKVFLLLWLAVRVIRLDRFWTSHGKRWWRQGIPWMVLFIAGSLMTPQPSQAAPSPELLKELESRLTAPPECGESCTSVSRARIFVADSADGRSPRIRIEAEVHATVDAAWPIPGPTSGWRPQTVRLDGFETAATRRAEDGFLYVRVPAGVHTILLDGALSAPDGMTLQFAQAPRAIRFDGPGFRMAGARRDGTVDETLQITRIQVEGSGTVNRGSDNLAPWVTVERDLDLGIPWRVTTTVRRHGTPHAPLTMEVPLLPGEALTDASHEVVDGRVRVAFDGSESAVSWTGTLALAEQIRLEAPADVAWTERWSLACSPVFSCATTASEGLAPISHVASGKWQPIWRPWPGETLDVRISRPESISGQTVTIDSLSLTTTPRARESTSTLALSIRTSQGGQHPIQLAPDAELLSLHVDSKAIPGRMTEGRLDVPLQPGTHQVEVTWSESQTLGLLSQVSSVDPGAPAVNATLTLDLDGRSSDWRWVVLSAGPPYGTKALHMFWVAGWMLVAWLLGRLLGPARTGAPFPTAVWAILLLGMSTAHPVVVLLVLAWLVGVIVRSKRAATHWIVHNLSQYVLLGALPVVGFLLLYTLASNLLDRPELWFEGPGNGTMGKLVWSVDRLEGALPRPRVVSLPGWSWRGLTLAWSLALVVAAARRISWMWAALGNGGWFRSAPGTGTPPATPPPSPAAPSPPPSTPTPSNEGSLGQPPDDPPPATAAPAPDTPHNTEDDPAFEETIIMASEFRDHASDDLELDSGEIEAGDEDSWVYDESSSFIESPLPEGQTQATFGGVAGVSVLRANRASAPSLPAVELPYDPDRHVEIGPPTANEDAIFVPAIDADPADYATPSGRVLSAADGNEE